MKIISFFITSIITIFIFSYAPLSYAEKKTENNTITTSVPTLAAQETDNPNSPNITNESNIVFVSINGLVCDFCARALEKVFGKEENISSIDVDLNSKIVTLRFKEGSTLLDNQTITQHINDAGYNVREIRRHD